MIFSLQNNYKIKRVSNLYLQQKKNTRKKLNTKKKIKKGFYPVKK